MNQAGADAYRTQEILTASPARLVAKLYESAIASLNKAIKAIEDKDIEGRWRANKHAIDVVAHLMETLNHDQGGQIATNLERIYRFIITHLIDVDLKNDPAPAREVINLLEPLHRSWIELDQQLAAEAAEDQAGAAAASPAPAGAPADTPAGAPASAPASAPGGYGSTKQPSTGTPAPRVIATA